MIDNPIWKSLSTGHAKLAIGNARVKRYPPRVAPFAALAEHTQESFHELEKIVEFDDAVCVLGEIPSTHKWDIISSGKIAQMIYKGEKLTGCEQTYRKMQTSDVPSMMELTDLVFKGYFREGTIDMGRYIGIFSGHKLAAMAGQRFAPEGFREISAVCTHPDFQRRGLAGTLVKCLFCTPMPTVPPEFFTRKWALKPLAFSTFILSRKCLINFETPLPLLSGVVAHFNTSLIINGTRSYSSDFKDFHFLAFFRSRL